MPASCICRNQASASLPCPWMAKLEIRLHSSNLHLLECVQCLLVQSCFDITRDHCCPRDDILGWHFSKELLRHSNLFKLHVGAKHNIPRNSISTRDPIEELTHRHYISKGRGKCNHCAEPSCRASDCTEPRLCPAHHCPRTLVS